MDDAHVPPLADVRIVAIEQYGAGPWGSLHLADMGAEVIKIENPHTGGDISRYIPPHQEGTDSLFFETFNRGKKSVCLDIASPAGRNVFEDLVSMSDVVYSNLRGDVTRRLKIRYDDLSHINPQIACCALSAYGTSGSRERDPGYDYVVQAESGWMNLTGEPDGPPQKSGLSLVDYTAGIVAALSVLAAVHAARRDGRGFDWDVSLFDTAISMLSYPASWLMTGGHEVGRTRHSAHPSLVPFQAFEGSDGNWFVIACAKEKFWVRLANAIGREDLANDPRFDSFDQRNEHRGELLAALEETFHERDAEAWVRTIQEAQVPCALVNSVHDALNLPLVQERGLIVETEHPRFGVVRQPTTASRAPTPGQPVVPDHRAPTLGEHTSIILGDLLGYSAKKIDRLREAGVFGRDLPPPPTGAGDGPTNG